jgi:hypothetical protein
VTSRTNIGLSAGGVKLIPTHYYGNSGKLVFKTYPWLAAATDGVLFYFRNDKGGQTECGEPSAANGGLCTPPKNQRVQRVQRTSDSQLLEMAGGGGMEGASSVLLTGAGGDTTRGTVPCTTCCLSGARAELSLKNINSEIADFAAALPPSHPLHIGVYFSGTVISFNRALSLPTLCLFHLGTHGGFGHQT